MLGAGPGDLKPHPLLMDCVITVLTELTLQLLVLHTALTLEEIFLQPPRPFQPLPSLFPEAALGELCSGPYFVFSANR